MDNVASFTDSIYMGSPFFHSATEGKRRSVYAQVEECTLSVQRQLCDFVRQYEVKDMQVDRWERAEGEGGGISCVLQHGKVFEKAGANVSSFTGVLSSQTAMSFKERYPQLKGDKFSFFVTGCSAMLHPGNPHVPAFHFNLRYFDVIDGHGNRAWWFGGCCDLAPCYIVEDEVTRYHRDLKNLCDQHGADVYKQYKALCDKYFYIVHRGEVRGVGGIFFDDLHSLSFEDCLAFVQALGNNFVSLYTPFVTKHVDDEFTEKQKNWQLHLRGRHVEFVLLYDRGLRFGLNLPLARVESVMMTLPPLVRFDYNYVPEPGTEEHRTLEVWKRPRDWVIETRCAEQELPGPSHCL